MSYYRPNFSATSGMTRGRGYSSSRGGGGGYRGSSRGSGWGGSPRGGYGSTRGSGGGGGGGGRFSSAFNSSFDSRSKYGSSDRYSSRPDDYRKSSYRPDGSRYSSGGDHRGSPDRKRLRTESLSSRHDSSYGSSGDGYGRYESSGGVPGTGTGGGGGGGGGGGAGAGSYSGGDHRRGGYGGGQSDRRGEFRKPAPPPGGPPAARGGYRGRGGPMRSRPHRDRPAPVRRRLLESSYVVRRRPVRPSATDYASRLKMARIRSTIVRHHRPIKKSKSDNEDSDKDDAGDDDDTTKKPKSEKDDKEDDKDDEDIDDDEDMDDDKKDTPSKKPKSSEDRDEKADDSDDVEGKSPSGLHGTKRFIRLVCPHCQVKCTTFGKYSLHLQSDRHIWAMRRISMKQKAILSRMRLMQRNAQRELEKTTDDLASRTSFCPLCKLNYKQPKRTHQTSESHKNMKRFLMPYCKTCKIPFKSPMLYESHCCSIEHIKRKALSEDKSDKEEGSGAEDNLENFMTIDSVGDIDEEEREKKTKDVVVVLEDPSSSTGATSSATKPKEQINVGIEHVKRVEVHYCDLCAMYLPRRDDPAEMARKVAEHCRQRTHLRRYVTYKEDRELARRAERLQRRETLEKEEQEKVVKGGAGGEGKVEEDEVKKEPQTPAGGSKENGEASLNEDEGDEKLWADVDKDLGIILAEAESGNKSSDEDEDDSVANGGRYDRFKTAEKNLEEKLIDGAKEDAMEADDAKADENEEDAAK